MYYFSNSSVFFVEFFYEYISFVIDKQNTVLVFLLLTMYRRFFKKRNRFLIGTLKWIDEIKTEIIDLRPRKLSISSFEPCPGKLVILVRHHGIVIFNYRKPTISRTSSPIIPTYRVGTKSQKVNAFSASFWICHIELWKTNNKNCN